MRSIHPWGVILIILLTSCVKAPPEISSRSYDEFSARLMVMEPAHRWQVLVNWHSNGKDGGWLRLTHALTGRIVELRWQQKRLWLRDNRAADTTWREIDLDLLASYGIPLFPMDVTRFLRGTAPDDFTRTGESMWTGKRLNSLIRVKWNPRGRVLRISDIKNGKIAILIINE